MIRNRKIQRDQNVDALADAERSREEGQCADGVIYHLDHVAKTTITTILVICVGCHIVIKEEIETLARLGQLTGPESQKMEEMYYEEIHHNMAAPLQVQHQVRFDRIALQIVRAALTQDE